MPSSIANKAYGTVSADRQMEMSGLEFVEELVSGALRLNTMGETLGCDIVEVSTRGDGFSAMAPRHA